VTGPFALAAEDLWRHGLVPIPCPVNDGDGKKPGVRFRVWRRQPNLNCVLQLVERFPDANVAVVTGLSGVTVVDIDDQDLVPDMIQRFGETPLMTTTPSGGTHLWYASQGERNSNLRAREDLQVDIKGLGGIVVVPPSWRPTGPHAGRPYQLQQGCWHDVGRLPTVRPGSIAVESIKTRTDCRAISTDTIAREGERNDRLFRQLLRHAPACDNFDAMLDAAHGVNMALDSPLSDHEVVKTAASAWQYEKDGLNLVGRSRRAYAGVDEYEALAALAHGVDGLFLLMKLRFTHWDHPTFAASPFAMARDGVIPSWGQSHDRYRRALKALVETGILIFVHRGGRGPHDPHVFKFADNGIK
jgi:hypothetical protein